ncbi:MAG: hypothetical protein RIR18_1651 [Pseudomonadota bacterium]|jgi:peptidoglycan/xylan/chitin deacetylase (PgdA/CDA1 family)
MAVLLNRVSTYRFWAVIWISLMMVGSAWAADSTVANKPSPPATAFVFKNVRGPTPASQVAEPSPEAAQPYDHGSTSRLAILLTDEDSSWLSLVHGLRTIGIPFRITRDYREALRHRVVMVYPTISGRVLSGEALEALANFPKDGGMLIGVNVEGGGLNHVFGFKKTAPSRRRSTITFNTTHAYTAHLASEKEQSIPFSNPAQGAEAFGSLAYLGATDPLAIFNDGTPAITQHKVGQGTAIAFGIDLGFLLSIGYNNREEGIARSYANGFEPTLDVLLRVLRNIYRAGEPNAVTLHTVPQGKPLSVILTHDIDYTKSLANAAAYAEFEAQAGVPATYFIQTKYVRDWNDNIFFNHEGVAFLKKLAATGVEIASHSVAHSRVYRHLTLGTGQEQYPDYRPFVRSATRTESASILGELRISRFLLQHFLPEAEVTSFRPGHLSNPYSAPQAMVATGYRYSSSTTANNSLTHLPFRLTYGRAGKAEVGVFEFPVTIEDEAAPRLLDRLPQALALADRLASYGASMVVLIHTDITGHKLEFEKHLVAELRNRAWFGSIRSFGDFWVARDGVEVDVAARNNSLQVHLHSLKAVQGLGLVLPPGYRVEQVEPAQTTSHQSGAYLVIDLAVGDTAITLAPEGSSK